MPEEISLQRRDSSVRQTPSPRGNVARQAAVNFLPSRQMCNTIRLRRPISSSDVVDGESSVSPPDVDQHAEVIVREMEQQERLMDDDPVAEGMRREALRDLPQGLTLKRSVRAKLSASVSLRSKKRPISVFKRFKYRLAFAFKRSKERFRDFIFSIELWYEAIRVIEGHYGSAVASYFYFLRWLFCLNLIISCFMVSFVVVPQALHDEGRNHTGQWGFLDFVSGKGSYEDTLLFYGHYHSADISPRGPRYNMPFAYFFTMASLYLTAFAVLGYRTALSYRRHFICSSAASGASLAARLFGGWDYSVVTARAARLCAATIYNELQELLTEQNKDPEKVSIFLKTLQYSANIVATIVVLAVIGGLEYGIWLSLEAWSTAFGCHWRPGVRHLVVIGGLEYGIWLFLRLETSTTHWQTLVSLTVTLALAALPVAFHWIVRLEFYSPRTSLYVTLCRTWLLDVGTLTVIFYFWARSDFDCWETSFGQESYRLILLDCLISLLLIPAFEFIRGLLFKLHPSSIPLPTFNIAYNSLTLIYNQAVLWYGMLFSPLLVVAVTLKFLLLFYVKRVSALKACRPAGKIWRAAQTQTVLYMLVTLSLFTTIFVFGTLYFKMPSQHCGPFVSYDYVYEVVTEGVFDLAHRDTARKVLQFLTRTWVLGFVGVGLCIAVYYMRAAAAAQRQLAEVYRTMLALQGKDKQFLLDAIAKVSSGEWMYHSRSEDDQHPSVHTWKYLNEVRKPSNAEFHFDASRLNKSQFDRSHLDQSQFHQSHPNQSHFDQSRLNHSHFDQSRLNQSHFDQSHLNHSHFDQSRLNQSASDQPRSKERPISKISDGDTDSSFSWQGSSSLLNKVGSKKWT